ncbi:hypothetical protein EVAR_6805_1 [Eumeta japonica]|uniref:Uncharacterized protein n=1 Tax=Eumeta variegata TaxID=151549 RepID=A0A4C1U637_EUMVA|nr:hypothetical protein EVAR_6805_1 [Eumeta japonica]
MRERLRRFAEVKPDCFELKRVAAALDCIKCANELRLPPGGPKRRKRPDLLMTTGEEYMMVKCYRWVPTKLNVADYVTRGPPIDFDETQP